MRNLWGPGALGYIGGVRPRTARDAGKVRTVKSDVLATGHWDYISIVLPLHQVAGPLKGKGKVVTTSF